MSETVTMKKFVTHPFLGMVCFISICFILPRYAGSIATMVASASILSFLVAVLPEQFRSRSGSMMAATCLVAALWVATAVITSLTLMGVI